MFARSKSFPRVAGILSYTLTLRITIVSALIYILAQKLNAQKALHAKYQDWNEDDGRIKVRSWYFLSELELAGNWSLESGVMIDSVSGATPYGKPPEIGPDDWLVEIEEERRAGTIELKHEGTLFDYSFEVGLSKEPDYVSKSYAFSVSQKIAEETLVLTGGFSYKDDEVDTSVPGGPGLGFLDKDTPEIVLGFYRILDDRTTLSLDVTYGRPRGYLSDPYKQIGLGEILFAGDPLREKEILYMHPENRPNKRETLAIFLQGRRYLETWEASIESSYRYFCDDRGLVGNTFGVKVPKRLGERIIIEPSFRYYHQEAADYYKTSLDDTGITPALQPVGEGSHYSADYRISKLHAKTAGLKLTYIHQENLIIDLSFDRYKMEGLDTKTSKTYYPKASITTAGFQWSF